MNPEIKTKWLEALRSGEYKQGTSRLKNLDVFCCLGVLCDLHSKEPGNARTWEERKLSATTYLDHSVRLPIEVIKWAGLPSSDPFIPYGYSSLKLSAINDRGDSFKSIADLIEKNL